MCENKNNFAKTPLAKQKHAEFMLKMAEIIYGIVLTGLLGTSVLVWFSSKEAQTNGSFGYFMTLSIVGIIGAICLQRQAMTIINQSAVGAESNIHRPYTTSSSTTNQPDIQIQHGSTIVSINIQPEKNNEQ